MSLRPMWRPLFFFFFFLSTPFRYLLCNLSIPSVCTPCPICMHVCCNTRRRNTPLSVILSQNEIMSNRTNLIDVTQLSVCPPPPLSLSVSLREKKEKEKKINNSKPLPSLCVLNLFCLPPICSPLPLSLSLSCTSDVPT